MLGRCPWITVAIFQVENSEESYCQEVGYLLPEGVGVFLLEWETVWNGSELSWTFGRIRMEFLGVPGEKRPDLHLSNIYINSSLGLSWIVGRKGGRW